MQLFFQRNTAWLVLLTSVIVATVVLIAYWPALGLGFFADDWIFYDLAGRLSLSDYLVKYFDPRVQTTWYRPVQGILFRIEYVVLGPNPFGYHLLNVLLHLANCFLLFALVQRITRRRQTGLIAALLFAGLPTAALAVFWPGVVDPLATCFFLITVWFWLSFLENEKRRDFWFAFGTFILALLTKEIAVILPPLLFLVELCWSQKRSRWTQRARRYVWFVSTWLAYVPIEYIVTQRSVFPTREGYQAGINSVWNLADYSSTLAFPWAYVPWLSLAGLLIAMIWLVHAILFKKAYRLIPLIAGAVLVVLPVAPFPVVANRFLYLPLLASVTVYAVLFGQLWLGLSRRWIYRAAALVALTLVVMDASDHVADSAIDFDERQRESYVTLQNVTQMHPTLLEDTFFYFVDPPVPGPTLSGMLLWRYGLGVSSGANDSDQSPRLRDHRDAFVVYFDNQGEQKELSVEKEIALRISPAVPASFNRLIELKGYEVTGTHLRAGEIVGLLLHWRAIQQFDQAYPVSVELVNSRGDIVVRQNSVPREWRDFASRRRAGESIVDAHILAIPSNAASGIYRLQVGLYDPATLEPVAIVGNVGIPVSDKVVIEPFVIVE